jgi:hypothetical protein
MSTTRIRADRSRTVHADVGVVKPRQRSCIRAVRERNEFERVQQAKHAGRGEEKAKNGMKEERREEKWAARMLRPVRAMILILAGAMRPGEV